MNLTRRSFMKLSAATCAVGALATGGALTQAGGAHAADNTQTKRVRSCCRGCGKMECGVWVTVENGRAVRVEGDESAFHRWATAARSRRRPSRPRTTPIACTIP